MPRNGSGYYLSSPAFASRDLKIREDVCNVKSKEVSESNVFQRLDMNFYAIESVPFSDPCNDPVTTPESSDGEYE